MADTAGGYKFKFKVKPETPEARQSAREARRARQPLHEWVINERQLETRFEVSGGLLPYPVEMELGSDQHGQVTLIGLHIGGEKDPVEITSTSLRQVGAAVSDLLHRLAEHRLQGEEWETWYGPVLHSTAVPYEGVALRPGRRGHSREYYRDVAEGFAAAAAEDPQHPYTILARRLFLSESQTRRLVKHAWGQNPDLRPAANPQDAGETT